MMTHKIDVNEKHPNLKELLSLIQKDTEIVLTEGDIPVARLTQISNFNTKEVENSDDITPKPGLHPGAIWISDDFDDPLPDAFWLGEEK